MAYTEEAKKDIQGAFEKLESEYDAIFLKFLALKLEKEEAQEFKVHGFMRRLGTLKNCIQNVYSIYPVERTDKPSKEELDNLAINIQAFIIAVFGCFDNMAWIWVKEKELKNKKGEPLAGQPVGLVSAKTHEEVRKTFSLEFQEYLNSLEKWFDQLTDYRHALAHRIPLYVPPFRITPAEAETYNRLEREKEEAIRAKEFGKYEALDAEQQALGMFDPIAVHSVITSSNPFAFHPQMIADFRTVAAVGEKFLAELERI